MNELTENETTNVIEVQFKQNIDDIPHDIAHPASKNFSQEIGDDPLYDLLHEFDDIILEDNESEISEDFIFHLVFILWIHL